MMPGRGKDSVAEVRIESVSDGDQEQPGSNERAHKETGRRWFTVPLLCLNQTRSIQLQGCLQFDFGRLGHLAVAHGSQNLKHFAPGGKLAAAAPFVVVHRTHEFDFILRVVAFAGGRVDLAAAFNFASIAVRFLFLFRTSVDGCYSPF